MTLIVSSLAGNCPLLLGDLLLSVHEPPLRKEINLPIQDVHIVGDLDYTITGFAQKTCLVTPNLAVGWSGTKIVAKTIILEMVQCFTSGRPTTFDELGKFFFDLDFPEANDVQMVGLVLEKKNFVRDFHWNARTHKSLLLGEIQLAGSGSDHFLQVLHNCDTPLITMGSPPEFVSAVGKLLMVACSVLGGEMNTRENLLHFYGGALEIVYFNQGRFEKLGNVTYVFWAVNVVAPDKLEIAAQVAVNCSYYKDILILLRISFRENVTPREGLEVFVVGPIHRNVDKTEIENLKRTTLPDLNSGFLCHYFAINWPDARRENFVIVDKGQPDLVKFTNEGNRLSFIVYEKFGQRLLEQIRSRQTPA